MFKFFRFTSLALAFALAGLCGLPTASAQSTTDGAIGGLIKDQTGAVVQNAAVTARNEETNRESTATSDDEGRFRIVQLQPGNYTITITATGFNPFTQQKVVVEVGRVTTLEIPLGVTGSTETIEVTSESPVINTTQQDFSTNINQTSINELPINGRRWSNFAILTPGSSPDGNFGLISFRGISGLLNNSTIDGGDNNQAFFSEERGRTRISYSISQSAIREFQVNTSNYSAEYGRAAGAVINAVTKSGTNEFHGDIFYYQRNNRWGARNPRATRTFFENGVTRIEGYKPEDVRHQFGGAVGGPIVQNKLFFFFSYDQQKRDFPGLAVFEQANYLSTVNRTALTSRGLTNAQIDNALAFLVSTTGEVPRTGDQKLFLPKIDWQINDSHSFSATYNRLRWDSPAGIQTQATNTRGRASFGDDFVDIDWVTLRLQSAFTPTLLNEARFQYGRDNEYQNSQDPIPGEPLTANGGTRSPRIRLTNGIEFGKPEFLERRAFPDETRWQFADNVTVSRASHTIKFGADINRVHDVIDNLRFEAGEYQYNNLNDFIIDYVNATTPGGLPGTVNCSANPTRFRGRCYTSNFLQGFGPTRSEFSTNDLNFYIQDDWRYSPRLTLNFGLRYEIQMMPDPVIPNGALPETSNLPTDKNNFGPRAGFAYDITGDGKTSIRGGYGIYYGRVPNAAISNALTNTGTTGSQNQVSIAATASNAPVFPNLVAAAAAGPPAVQFFDDDFESPEIHQADLVFEREIAKNTVASASLLYSQGRKLPIFIDTNICPPGSRRNTAVAGTNCASAAPATVTLPVLDGPFAGQTVTIPFFAAPRPNPSFAALTEIRSVVRSSYWGLVLQANRRFTDGLQFQGSYTLARAEDQGQTSAAFPQTNTPFNPFAFGEEASTSAFDVRHKVVVSAVWTPDFFGDQGDSKVGRAVFNGFTIAPIFQYFSGRPLNGVVSGGFPNPTGFANAGGGISGSGGNNRFPLLPRNAFREPSIWNMDLRVSRRFNITEATNLEFLVEGFNIFNRTQATFFNNTFYSVRNNRLEFNPAFLDMTEAGGTLFRERQIQLAVRFQF
ncbi:MAG TPA: carboxypeptidase regulatory-like domain-containing protein [Pyrinomonadaceae bacterium]|nr:carboxypeptidase regulatory-like domain-containing protein [Pyrinomonadaceae bacterium]